MLDSAQTARSCKSNIRHVVRCAVTTAISESIHVQQHHVAVDKTGLT